MSSASVIKVRDLKPGMENIAVVVRVLQSFGARTIETKAGIRTLNEYVVGDDTGKVKLVIWGVKAPALNVGEVVEITNAWVSAFRGEVQLNAGRSSSISKASEDAVPQSEEIPDESPKAEEGKRARPSAFGPRGGRGSGPRRWRR